MLRKHYLLSTLALMISAPTFADNSSLEENINNNQAKFATTAVFSSAMIAGWILDGAKSAVKGEAKSFITSLLFGNGNTGPQIVRIHQDDLDKIESIVSGIVLTSDVEDAKSQFESFGDTIEYYRNSAQGGNLDTSILPVLLDYTTSLKNHRAYKESYNPKSYALTSSYALIASMSIAVLTERKLQGYISYGYVQSQARSLASRLISLGAQTDNYTANLGRIYHFGNGCYGMRTNKNYVDDSVPSYSELKYNDSSFSDDSVPMAPKGCLIRASFPGMDTKQFDTAVYGWAEAEELAYEYINEARDKYRTTIKGENFNQILSTLNNF